MRALGARRRAPPVADAASHRAGQRRRAAGEPLGARTAATRLGRERTWKCTRKKRAPNGARFLLPFSLRGGFAVRAFALRLSAQGLCVGTNMTPLGRKTLWKINKARQDHIHTYDETNRMVSIRLSKAFTNCACNSLDTLALEAVGNKSVDYKYNVLNQLVKKATSRNEVFTYICDARGNRISRPARSCGTPLCLIEWYQLERRQAFPHECLSLRVNNGENSLLSSESW